MKTTILAILLQSLLTPQPIVFEANDAILNMCIDQEAEKRAPGSISKANTAGLVWTLCHAEWRKARLNAIMSAPLWTPVPEVDTALKVLERKYRDRVDEKVASEIRKLGA